MLSCMTWQAVQDFSHHPDHDELHAVPTPNLDEKKEEVQVHGHEEMREGRNLLR